MNECFIYSGHQEIVDLLSIKNEEHTSRTPDREIVTEDSTIGYNGSFCEHMRPLT